MLELWLSLALTLRLVDDAFVHVVHVERRHAQMFSALASGSPPSRWDDVVGIPREETSKCGAGLGTIVFERDVE